MSSSIGEALAYSEAYYKRLEHDYRQTRLLGYIMVNLVQDQKTDIEEWMPMWFDGTAEERRKRKEVEGIKRGMVAEEEIEHYRSLGINI